MNNRFMALLLSAVILIPAQKALAEIYNCNGSWTNKPCQGGAAAAATLKERQRLSPPSAPMRKEEKTAGGADSTCRPGQKLITTRPNPKADWVTNSMPKGTQETQVSVEGKVEGHGKVDLDITGSGRIGDAQREKALYSTTLSLPNSGGNQKFRTSFTIPVGWNWEVKVENKGSFTGYCASEGQ